MRVDLSVYGARKRVWVVLFLLLSLDPRADIVGVAVVRR